MAYAYGHKVDLERMQRDLSELGHNSMVHQITRDHGIPTQYGLVEFATTDWELIVSSREFSELLLEKGMPVGSKTVSDHRVPEWIMKGPLAVKRAFMAGLFGAELSAPVTLTKTSFNRPIIAQNKNDEHLESARLFFIDLMQILEEFGIEVMKISERKDFYNHHRNTSRLRLLIRSDEDNMVRLYRTIGYEYSESKSSMAEVAVKYMLLKKELHERRVRVADEDEGAEEEGAQAQGGPGAPRRARISTRASSKGTTTKMQDSGITLDFVSFKEFLAKERSSSNPSGFLYDEITSCRRSSVQRIGLRLHVEDTHNFVANGMVVSNCGVRLVRTDLEEKDVRPGIKDLIGTLFKNVPAGVGSEGRGGRGRRPRSTIS